MKPSLAVSLLLLFSIISCAQGLRKDKGSFMSVLKVSVNEYTRTKNAEYHGVANVAGKTRKLNTVDKSISTSTMISNVGEEYGPATSSEHDHREKVDDEESPEVVDITEMDYSPATKKPPIHN